MQMLSQFLPCVANLARKPISNKSGVHVHVLQLKNVKAYAIFINVLKDCHKEYI